MRKLTEVLALLEKPWDGPTEERDGFTYLPWNNVSEELDSVFGIDGYVIDIRETRLERVGETYGYSAIARITAYALDDDGKVVTMVRENTGFNELNFTNERTRVVEGKTIVTPPRALIDTSIKGAASGAIVRAAMLFGNHFGRTLYSKAGRAAVTPQYTAPTGVRQLSDAQKGFLVKLGYKGDEIAQMSYTEAKNIMDNKIKATATVGAKASRSVDSTVVDIDF